MAYHHTFFVYHWTPEDRHIAGSMMALLCYLGSLSFVFRAWFVTCDVTAEPSSKTQTTNVYCYPADVAEELLKQSDCSSSESSLAPDSVSGGNVTDAGQPSVTVTDQTCDSDDSSAMESFDDFEDFCIIDEPGLGILVSSAVICDVLFQVEMQLYHVVIRNV